MDKQYRCVYDPETERDKSKGSKPIYKPIVPGAAKAVDPRSREKYRKYTLRGSRALYAALPVPHLVYDDNWVGVRPPTRFLVLGLEPLITESHVRHALVQFGTLEECKLARNPLNATSLGICEAKFQGNLSAAHRLARDLVAQSGSISVGSTVVTFMFDDKREYLDKVVSDLVKTQEAERAREQARIERAQQREEMRKEAERAAATTQNHRKWMVNNIGPRPYVFISAKTLPTETVSVQAVERFFRGFRFKEVHSIAFGFYIVFESSKEARDACQRLQKRTIAGYTPELNLRKPPKAVFDFEGPERSESNRSSPRGANAQDQQQSAVSKTQMPTPASQTSRPPMSITEVVNRAKKILCGELAAALRRDIHQRVVMPLILENIQPSKYPELARDSPVPAPTSVVAPALTSGSASVSTAAGIQAGLAQVPLLSGSMRNGAHKKASKQNPYDLPRFKKRVARLDHMSMDADGQGEADLDSLEARAEIEAQAAANSAGARKRRKIEFMYSDSEDESDEGRHKSPAALATESPDTDIQMEDVYAKPTGATVVLGPRPRSLHEYHASPSGKLYLDDFRSLILDDEDLLYAKEAMALVKPSQIEDPQTWLNNYEEKERIHRGQDEVPNVPKDMLDIDWKPVPGKSWRSRGFVEIPSTQKSAYLLHRRRDTAITAETGRQETSNNTQGDATATTNSSRNARMSNRRMAQDLNLQKQSLSVETDLLDFNQLLKRRKPVKFARSSIHNWGLYSMENINQNDMIIEYVGQVIRAPLADLRERNYVRAGIGSSYLFRIDEETVIDATKRGGIARFINHCCTPSCTAKIIKVGGTKRIVIYALRDIKANEELTYDYKFEREEGEDRIPCLCGSVACKGFLN